MQQLLGALPDKQRQAVLLKFSGGSAYALGELSPEELLEFRGELQHDARARKVTRTPRWQRWAVAMAAPALTAVIAFAMWHKEEEPAAVFSTGPNNAGPGADVALRPSVAARGLELSGAQGYGSCRGR